MRFSIITCTYNPEPEIFRRVLDACDKLVKKRRDTEFIIVDNNSEPPVTNNPKVADLLTKCESIRLVTEARPGQTYARIAGARVARGEVFIFADDDNVLSEDYITALEELLEERPEVSVWGPADILVEFPAGAPLWLDRHFRHLFQERKSDETRWGLEAEWTPYYPVGSGMAIKRAVFERYAGEFAAGHLTAGGRSGGSLLCGEDAQMVWSAIKLGQPAGTSPALKLMHLIAARKTRLRYLQDQQFNIAYSYVHALAEMFPEKKAQFKSLSFAGHLRLVAKTIFRTKFNPMLFYRTFVIEKAWFAGVRKWIKDNESHKR
jgi:glycosyltransferase involved in cell wall biosynthesis